MSLMVIFSTLKCCDVYVLFFLCSAVTILTLVIPVALCDGVCSSNSVSFVGAEDINVVLEM